MRSFLLLAGAVPALAGDLFRRDATCPAAKSAFTCPDANGLIFTDGSGYSYEIVCGSDSAGSTLTGSGAACADLDTCIAKCSATDGCAWASFENGVCNLKSAGSSTSSSSVWGASCIGKPGSSASVPSKPSGTAGSLPGGGSWSSQPTGSGESGSGSGSGSYGSGSGSGSGGYGSGSGSGSGSYGSGSSKSAFSTLTKPSHSAATYSAGSHSTKTSSGSPSSCTANPKAAYTAGTIPGCKRCEGQPGTDQFCGFDINTDYYENTPITCNVVTYEFDISETEDAAPDGYQRFAMLVNGQLPGPEIKASWGDTVVVKVNNKMTTNGTSIHFHGLRQMNNNANDGVPSITQCPIAPGDSFTYTWVAENYGTSWYHSHYALQAWEGVHGPITIEGPTTAAFDVDLGTYVLEDWSHFTVDQRYDLAENATQIPGEAAGTTFGGPVTMDNGLINGKNVWLGANGNSTPIGERYVEPTALVPGKKYLLRFINSAMQSTFKVYLDSHEFEVIASDFVPINPYTTEILNINVGQRYDVIFTANQASSSYWLRADIQNSCAATVQALDVKAIFNYEGHTGETPSSTAYTYTGECVDESPSNLVPYLPKSVGAADFTTNNGSAFELIIQGNAASLYKWYLSGTTFQSQWGDPTLLDIAQNGTVPDYSGNLLIDTPNKGDWTYVIIESPIPLPHPVHLHGHDFYVLGAGSGTYDNNALTLVNPPRRDTALLPAAGWLVLGFQSDNPGVWLMHCHIGWHASMGFALQFVELQDQIKTSGALGDTCAMSDVCTKWHTWADANGLAVATDSGI